jgi:hypothetical protein
MKIIAKKKCRAIIHIFIQKPLENKKKSIFTTALKKGIDLWGAGKFFDHYILSKSNKLYSGLRKLANF